MPTAEPFVLAFEEHRYLLQGIAYRMLGSVADAEDMVQETWLRWAGQEAKAIDSPRAWLVTTVTRLCLDRLKSARVQREQYFGTWLPEPFVSVAAEATSEVDESVSIALLLVLEKLSPVERAGFLLYEVFDHSFEEIAAILEKSAVACRKIVSRARSRVRAEKPRFSSTHGQHQELLTRFLQACRAGELEPLVAMLGEDAAFYSDGGGKVTAVPKVMHGAEPIARFFLRVSRNRESPAHAQTQPAFFNGVPGLLVLLDGRVVSAISLDVADGKIRAIHGLRNPDKLRVFHRADSDAVG